MSVSRPDKAWISWAAATIQRRDQLSSPPRLPDIPEQRADDLQIVGVSLVSLDTQHDHGAGSWVASRAWDGADVDAGGY